MRAIDVCRPMKLRLKDGAWHEMSYHVPTMRIVLHTSISYLATRIMLDASGLQNEGIGADVNAHAFD